MLTVGLSLQQIGKAEVYSCACLCAVSRCIGCRLFLSEEVAALVAICVSFAPVEGIMLLSVRECSQLS